MSSSNLFPPIGSRLSQINEQLTYEQKRVNVSQSDGNLPPITRSSTGTLSRKTGYRPSQIGDIHRLAKEKSLEQQVLTSFSRLRSLSTNDCNTDLIPIAQESEKMHSISSKRNAEVETLKKRIAATASFLDQERSRLLEERAARAEKLFSHSELRRKEFMDNFRRI